MTATKPQPNLDHPSFALAKGAFSALKFRATEFRGQSTLIVEPGQVHAVLSFLKSDARAGYNYLVDVAGVDYLGYPTPTIGRFAVVYILRNLDKDDTFFVKTFLDPSLPTGGIEADPALMLESVTNLWLGAEWMEREIFDMLGIRFRNHPDLRRILTWETYPAHPLRKDYPLRGEGEREMFKVVDRTSA